MEIRKKIAEQIANISPKVEETVVEILVESEVTKRSSSIVRILEELAVFEKDLKRIKPDQVSCDIDGKVVSETYSKSKAEEIKKLKEKIEKFTKAIDKALIGDMNDVYNLNSQKD